MTVKEKKRTLCDICGNDIRDKLNGWGALKVRFKVKQLGAFKENTWYRIDVCSDCKYKMIRWIKENKK